MRLPTQSGDASRVNEEAATALIHEAVSSGINYIDTAWPYHGGQSEHVVGRALENGWRDRVQLATKCPVWEVKAAVDIERLIDAQLAKLRTDRIDFYLLHALDGCRWKAMREVDATRVLERARGDGRVGHIGFSFHGSLDDFRATIDGYDWEFCQIQLNYLDVGFQAGLQGLRYAASRNVGVIVMEPLRGGALARVPPRVRAVWERSGRSWSPAEWALRWVWSLPEVVTVLSGMGTLHELKENAASASQATPLSPEDLARVSEVQDFYRAKMAVPCTTCGYCQPCPNGVAIPGVFSAYNSAKMFDARQQAAWVYDTFVVKANAGVDRCTECGDCESKCPQSFPIATHLKAAHAFLTGA
jgi:predicted aldo/keto reductase-like oxidoreductase